MTKNNLDQPSSPNEWKTISSRVSWLVQSRFRGNCSAFAQAIGLSHTSVNKVVAGRGLGGKFLAAVVKHLKVNPAWLLSGEGRPFTVLPGSHGRGEIPVSTTLLPGAPLEHQDLITGWSEVSDQLWLSSQYWLRLISTQPIVREPHRGFCIGDELLMETDLARFPRKDQLHDRLCIVRFEAETPRLKLGSVTHSVESGDGGQECLEVDTFDRDPDPSRLVREDVYRHYPNGEIQHHQNTLKTVPFRGGQRTVLMDDADAGPPLPGIRYTDIVAVWLGLLRRPRGVCG